MLRQGEENMMKHFDANDNEKRRKGNHGSWAAAAAIFLSAFHPGCALNEQHVWGSTKSCPEPAPGKWRAVEMVMEPIWQSVSHGRENFEIFLDFW